MPIVFDINKRTIQPRAICSKFIERVGLLCGPNCIFC